jgi:EAL domain-containing protein (putative c-di-GMP-specific phosphodiesterase class I)
VDEVDQSFVSGLGRNAEDSAIVTGVVGMAQTLGLTAIAEGVETEEQLSALQTLGCDLAQGYLFGRPEPPDGFGELRDAALVSA